VDWL